MLIFQISDHLDEEEIMSDSYRFARCVHTSLVINLLRQRGLTVMLNVLFSVKKSPC